MKNKIIKNIIFINIILLSSLFVSGCISNKEEVTPNKKVTKVKKKEVSKKVVERKEKKVEIFKELTPLEECKIKNGVVKYKYNLIISAPKYSKIKILNIKPKYKDCMILPRGKYLVEVSKKGYKNKKQKFTLIYDTNLKIELEKLPKKIAKKKIITKKKKNTKKVNSGFIASKSLYDGYSPIGLMGSKSCNAFYPKNLVDSVLTISSSLKTWNSIKWSGKCKNKFMHHRGTLNLKSNKGLSVTLKGKMKNGFFDGMVYISSKASEKSKYSIKEESTTHKNISLKTKDDYKRYQH